MKRKTIRFGHNDQKKSALPTEPVSLTIDSMNHEGKGVARCDGKAVFVEDALVGETVLAKVTVQHKRYDEAQLTEVISASPDRIAPLCKHYNECGGCQLQHMAPEAQLLAKQENVSNQLLRLGGITQPELEAALQPPITSPHWKYRRAARIGLNVLQRNDEAIVGFRRKKSNKLLQISECPVLDPKFDGIFLQLKELLDQQDNKKAYTHAELLAGDTAKLLLIRCKQYPSVADQERFKAFATEHGYNLHLKTDEVTLCLNAQEQDCYTLAKHDIQLHYHPGDFLQVNAVVNEAMIQQAIDWLDLSDNDVVLDLFSGLGNFTLPIARHVKHVIGIEGVDTMVERASKNAALNNIGNASFFRADLSDNNQKQKWFKESYTKIILDPPRTGAYELINQLPARAKSILYVSCEPSALARDSKLLQEKGYRLTRYNVMDMFPHTSHIESMALFTKMKK